MILYETHTYDAIELRGAGHIRVVAQHRVAHCDGPTPARWAGQAVVIVGLTWGARDERQAILASGMRIPLGECSYED
jgi:hypothetical protein